MFKIQNGKLIWGDCEYHLPPEVKDKAPKRIFGTATAGLQTKRGILMEINGQSATVQCIGGELSGHLLSKISAGTLVYLREQMDPVEPSKTFWVISTQEIVPQLNWINVEFEDGTLFRICPFTMYYKVWRE